MECKNHAFPLFVVRILVVGVVLCGGAAVADAPAGTDQTSTSKASSNEKSGPELMAYKAKFHQIVKSLWIRKMMSVEQLVGSGRVDIQYTIFADGRITTKVLDAGSPNMQILLKISLDSLSESSPFTPFSEALRKEVGESYTDNSTFSTDDIAPANSQHPDTPKFLNDAKADKLITPKPQEKPKPSDSSPAPKASQVD